MSTLPALAVCVLCPTPVGIQKVLLNVADPKYKQRFGVKPGTTIGICNAKRVSEKKIVSIENFLAVFLTLKPLVKVILRSFIFQKKNPITASLDNTSVEQLAFI